MLVAVNLSYMGLADQFFALADARGIKMIQEKGYHSKEFIKPLYPVDIMKKYVCDTCHAFYETKQEVFDCGCPIIQMP